MRQPARVRRAGFVRLRTSSSERRCCRSVGPSARCAQSVVRHQQRLYLFGGFDGAANCQDLWAYELEGEPRWM